jgi:hypothetical protein
MLRRYKMTDKKELLWTTKDGRKIPLLKMEDKHLLNSLRMCENAQIIANDYLRASTNPILAPRGEYATIAFEEESDSVFEISSNLALWIPYLKHEVKKRNLTPLPTKKPLSMPKIKSVQNLEFGTLYEIEQSESPGSDETIM